MFISKRKFLELRLMKNVKPRVQSCSEDKERSPVPCEASIVRKGLHCRFFVSCGAAAHRGPWPPHS